MQQLPLGIDKENILVIETGHRLGENGEAFRNELSHLKERIDNFLVAIEDEEK